MNRPDQEQAHNLLHRLWTKAPRDESYVKADWMALEALIWGRSGLSPKPAMTDERALEVISPLLDCCLARLMGPKLLPIPDFDLAEALAAAAHISMINERPIPEGAGRIIEMTIDPRGLAALYVMAHWEPQSNDGRPEPVMVTKGRGLFLLELPEEGD